jgi:hypothetical protein
VFRAVTGAGVDVCAQGCGTTGVIFGARHFLGALVVWAGFVMCPFYVWLYIQNWKNEFTGLGTLSCSPKRSHLLDSSFLIAGNGLLARPRRKKSIKAAHAQDCFIFYPLLPHGEGPV